MASAPFGMLAAFAVWAFIAWRLVLFQQRAKLRRAVRRLIAAQLEVARAHRALARATLEALAAQQKLNRARSAS